MGQNLLRAEGKWLLHTWYADPANSESYQERRKVHEWNMEPRSQSLYEELHLGQAKFPLARLQLLNGEDSEDGTPLVFFQF